MGKNAVKTEQWFKKCYRNSVPSITTIKRWFAEFKCGRTDTDDAERSGRPNDAVIPENIEEMLTISMENPKVKLQEIADTLKILVSESSFPNGYHVFPRQSKTTGN
ncbi:unnamed protein product [Diabrotica balteata]|uniref:Mos1 transposase HTH domain-containing protein n=1 Tax=Diabrotica balteata TaxID=107213 RepID=A0A9N9T0Z4_DIABA|nr:unnamed protein product [Diabrotica balteata]